MNGASEKQASRKSSARTYYTVDNCIDDPLPNERSASPSNLLIVSVTCCANDIWNRSSTSPEPNVGEPVVSQSVETAASVSTVGDPIENNAVEPKPLYGPNDKPPFRVFVNKRSRMPVVTTKKSCVTPVNTASNDLVVALAANDTPVKSKDAILDTNTESSVKTNSDEVDVNHKVTATESDEEHKNSNNSSCEVEKVQDGDVIEDLSVEEKNTKPESETGMQNGFQDDNSLNGNVNPIPNEPVTVSLKERRKRRKKKRVLFAVRRSNRCRTIEMKLNAATKSRVDTPVEKTSLVDGVLLPRMTEPPRMKRKYVRKINAIKSPEQPSDSTPADLIIVKPKEQKLTASNKAEIIAKSLQDKEPVRSCKKKKDFRRARDLGDLVWVKTSGRPWWPAQVTLDSDNTNFKRDKISVKRATSYMAEYHITTFGNPSLNCWVLANYLLDFRGKKVFEEYVTQLMKPIPKDTVLYAQLKWRFCVKESIRRDWEKVVKEVEDSYKIHLEELREKDLIDPLPPRRIKKRNRARMKNVEESDELPAKKRKLSPDGEEVRKKSDSDAKKDTARKKSSTVAAVKSQSILFDLEDIQQVKKVMKKVAPSKSSATVGNKICGLTTLKIICPKLSPKTIQERGKNIMKKTDSAELEPINKGSKIKNALTSKNDSNNSALIRKRNKNQQLDNSAKKKLKLSNGEESSAEQAVPSTKPKPKKQNVNGLTPTKKSVDRYVERVCHICEKMIMTEPTVRCHGICKSVVHVACAIPPPLTDAPHEEYKCETCITGSHSCFVCKKIDGEVRPCRATHCGKLYHAPCLDQFRNSRIDEQSVMCPAHSCMSCILSYSRVQSFNGNRSYRCIRCPFAYHANDFCLPAGSIILSNSVIICPRHYKPKKARKDRPQHVNVNWCFVCSNGGSLICCESCPASFHAECLNIEPPEGSYYCCECLSGMQPKYGDIVWVKLGNYRWWPAKICNPKNVPINIRNLPHDVGEFPVCFFGTNDFHWTSRSRVFHFLEGDQGAHITSSPSSCLAKRFQTALAEACEAFKSWKTAKDVAASRYNSTSATRPPYYKHILTNRPFGKVTVHTANLSMMTPCECSPNSENPCGSDTECLNRMLMFECHPAVCLAGERCNNQRFQKRQYPPTEIFLSEGKGWGLRCLTDIKKGDFVNEYVGEIIDEEECRRRMKKMHEENNTSYYFLTIDKDRIIDAGKKGNYSRFMNHSCRPNNETRKWTVNGDTRVGLFALCDIPSGTELTFNYNLDCLGNEKILCKCAELNCSIYIGERPKVLKPCSKKKPDTSRKKRRKSRLSRVEHDDLCFRCGEDGHLVLCDRKGCTKAFHLECLNMKKPPHGRWECPWHHCYHCGKQSSSLCLICPNSFCKDHTAGNINLLPDGSIYCNEHTNDHFAPDSVNEKIASTTETVSDEIMTPSQSTVVDSEDKSSNSEAKNSIPFLPIKLNGAEVPVKLQRRKEKSVESQQMPNKKLSSRKRNTQACKSAALESDEQIKEETRKCDTPEAEVKDEKSNCVATNCNDDETSVSDVPSQVKPTPTRRKWKITAVKNGNIINKDDDKVVDVPPKKKSQNDSVPSRTASVPVTSNKSKLKQQQLDSEKVPSDEVFEINEKQLENFKISLQKKLSKSEDSDETGSSTPTQNPERTETSATKVNDNESKLAEMNENRCEVEKDEDECQQPQEHCQDITM